MKKISLVTIILFVGYLLVNPPRQGVATPKKEITDYSKYLLQTNKLEELTQKLSVKRKKEDSLEKEIIGKLKADNLYLKKEVNFLTNTKPTKDTVYKEKIIEYIPKKKGLLKALVDVEYDTLITIK